MFLCEFVQKRYLLEKAQRRGNHVVAQFYQRYFEDPRVCYSKWIYTVMKNMTILFNREQSLFRLVITC